MKQTGKRFAGIIAAALIIVAGFTVSGCEKTGVKETFKIGVSAPLTGNVGFVGEGMKNAMLLAKERLGDTKYNYEFIFEDSQFDPKVAASAAHKLISIDKVDAIVSVGHGGPIISPLATKNDIIHFSISIQPWLAEGDNNFLHWAPSRELNRVLVEELQRRGIKKVGVFRTVSFEGWAVYLDDFNKRRKGTDIMLVTDQTFQDGTKDFRELILKAKKSNPDIYLLLAQTPELEILAKQIKEAGIDTPLTSIESFEATKETDLFEGYWYVSAISPTSDFTDAYEKQYHDKPPVASANAYDIVNLIVTAVEKAGAGSPAKPATAKISKELRKIKNFPGALGNLVVGDDGIVLSGVQLKMIKNGEHVVLGE